MTEGKGKREEGKRGRGKEVDMIAGVYLASGM